MRPEAFLTELDYRTGRSSTEEQADFILNFNKSQICFAKPGTGKTESATKGLVTAQLYHKIPPNSIAAISFTKAAALELKQRHVSVCEKLGINSHKDDKNGVRFSTFSSMCLSLLRENYQALGLKRFDGAAQPMNMDMQAEFLIGTARANDFEVKPDQVRNIVNAVSELNSSLIFDRIHVESKMSFKKTKLNFEEFTCLRREMYNLSKIMNKIQIGDILLYTLELLLKNPGISSYQKSRNKLILIDECQDMSLLQVKLLSMLTENLIAVGDINQQIYAFNGACQEIVAEYKKLFPEHREVFFTKSFRCAKSVADYATPLILPNVLYRDENDNITEEKNTSKMTAEVALDVAEKVNERFVGTEEEGLVETVKGVNIKHIAEKVGEEFRANKNTFKEEIMFLFRNGYSIVPIAEELFQQKVPFRISNFRVSKQGKTNFTKAYNLPVIKDLKEIVEVVRNPYFAAGMDILRKLIPEFKSYNNFTETPIAKIMTKEACDIFTACSKYNFKDKFQAELVINPLIELGEIYGKHENVKQLFDIIYQMYYDAILKYKVIYMERSPEYWLRLVEPLINSKNYMKFIRDEDEKEKFITKWEDKRYGIKCYTMHSAKGLEADIIYVLDVEDATIPNQKEIDRMIKAGCSIDAAREIRNERCLAYVTITRAKKKVYLCYEEKLSRLFMKENPYENFDIIYKSYNPSFKDVENFVRFTNADQRS